MSRYGPLVEQEMARIDPAPFSIADLQRLRERKRRNQRLAAGVVALLITGATVGGLGWALLRGGTGSTRPAGAPARGGVFRPADLEWIALRPEEPPRGTEHRSTLTGLSALQGPVSQSRDLLSVGELAGAGTGFVDARTVDFQKGDVNLPASRWFASMVTLYEEDASADQAFRILVRDFLGRDENARSRDVPELGSDAVLIPKAVVGSQEGPGVAYIWRIRNLVLMAVGAPGLPEDRRGILRQVRANAEQMNARALQIEAG